VTALGRLKIIWKRNTQMDTWRDRVAVIRPYALPVTGLGSLSVGVGQYGYGPGLITAGVSVLLVEYDRRVRRAVQGEQP